MANAAPSGEHYRRKRALSLQTTKTEGSKEPIEGHQMRARCDAKLLEDKGTLCRKRAGRSLRKGLQRVNERRVTKEEYGSNHEAGLTPPSGKKISPNQRRRGLEIMRGKEKKVIPLKLEKQIIGDPAIGASQLRTKKKKNPTCRGIRP